MDCTLINSPFGNGTQQRGESFPICLLGMCDVRPLIKAISQSNGCNIGGLFVNRLAYADDMEILEMWCIKLDIMCDTKKTVCVVLNQRVEID